MRLIVSALVAASILSAGSMETARAADLPRRPEYKAPVYVAPVPSWTGCYVGGNVGAGWGRAQLTEDASGAGVSGTNSGFVGGVQIGCDYQLVGGFVVGAREMFDGSSLNSGSTFASGTLAGSTVDSKTQWFSILTARVGYAVMPNALVYFQAGGAWTRTTQTVTSAGVQIGQFANNRGGYDLGGGVEYMFAPNWSAFLEYNYMNFGSESGTTSTGVAVSAKHDTQAILVGLNYRFR